MKVLLPVFLFPCLLLDTFCVVGRPTDPSPEVDSLYQCGMRAINERAYSQAVIHFEHAVNRGEAQPATPLDSLFWNAYTQSVVEWGDLYFRNREHEQAIAIFQRGLEVLEQYLPPDHIYLSDIHNMIGGVYDEEAQFALAESHFQQALQLRQTHLGEESLPVSSVYNNLGLLFKHQGEYDQALAYFHLSLTIKRKLLGSMNPRVASTLLNLGTIYQEKGDFDQSLVHYQEALAIREANYDPVDLRLASVYQGISVVYRLSGNVDLALRYLDQGLAIVEAQEGDRSVRLARFLQNKGVLYEELGDFDQSIYFQQEALQIFLEQGGKHAGSIAACHHNLGINYYHKGEYQRALLSLNQALKYYTTTLVKNTHPDKAKTLSGMGDCFAATGRWEEAAENYHASLQIRMNVFGKKHPLVARNFNQLGKIAQHPEKAMHFYQAAMVANVVDFSAEDPSENPKPILQHILSEHELIKSLVAKADLLRAGPQDARYEADSIYQLAITIGERTRLSYREDGDRLTLQASMHSVYEKAIQHSIRLARETHNVAYLHQAFQLAEKAQGALLYASLKEVSAREGARIPLSLLKQEQQLRVDLTYYEQQFNVENAKLERGSPEELARYQQLLFIRKNTYDSLIQVFEDQYPDYYRLKYDLETVGVATVQQALLKKGEQLLSYFVGDSSIFLFQISPDTIVVHQKPRPSNLGSIVKAWRETLVHPGSASQSPSQLYEEFTLYGHKLYQVLLEGVHIDPSMTQKLWIIPGGLLGYLPFDILIQEVPKDTLAENYLELAYLGRNFPISYAYSATLLMEQQKMGPIPRAIRGLGGYAPNYSRGIQVGGYAGDSLARQPGPSKVLGELPYAAQEVSLVANLWEGDAFIGEAATESHFKSQGKNYQIIHLAMHAWVNDQGSGDAQLLFTPNADSLNDQRLYASELYNLSLNADLVVLSACNTGMGKLQRGEGIMNLSRAFTYAGCPATVMSLWEAPDQTTAIVMQLFYQYLKKGYTKDEALHKAKIEFLSTVEAVEWQHPYFWAGFIPSGNMKSIQLNRPNKLGWVMWGGLIFLLSIGIWVGLRKSSILVS